MCNCGKKRNEYTALTASTASTGSTGKKMWNDSMFMYTGQTALNITGYISGKKYRFDAPGDQQLIDYRDAAAMMNVPVLKKVG